LGKIAGIQSSSESVLRLITFNEAIWIDTAAFFQKSWSTNEYHCRSAKLHAPFGKAVITVYGGEAVVSAMDITGVPPEALHPHTVLHSLRVSALWFSALFNSLSPALE
jgi:hypothetical protein